MWGVVSPIVLLQPTPPNLVLTGLSHSLLSQRSSGLIAPEIMWSSNTIGRTRPGGTGHSLQPAARASMAESLTATPALFACRAAEPPAFKIQPLSVGSSR